MLGDIHRVAECNPDIARRMACRKGIRCRHPELVQNDVANEGATEVLAELGGHGQCEL